MNRKISTSSILFLLFAAALAGQPLYAAELVNINTADQASLETLNGIGPSKAQAIITYRTQNGPFSKIEDIMNVSGIGTATFNNIKDYITVGAGSTAQTSAVATSSVQTPTQAQSQNQAAGAGPPTMTVRVNANRVVTAGGGSFFEAQVYVTDALPVAGARYIWNFGDGATAEGARVFHTYAYPGRYSVLVTAAYNYSSAMSRTAVDAVAASVSLAAEGDGSLLIRNLSGGDLNIGLWSLSDGGKQFVIPEDTLVLAGEGVRFAGAVTGLSGTRSAVLLYQNGAPAAAATVSAGSPLRGERVAAAPRRAPAAAQKQGGEVLGSSTSAPAPTDGGTSPLVLSAGALVVLLAGGAAGAHYAGLSAKRRETNSVADEFDIEG